MLSVQFRTDRIWKPNARVALTVAIKAPSIDESEYIIGRSRD